MFRRIPVKPSVIPASRRELFRDINILMKSGGGNLNREFPYTDKEIMSCRTNFWDSIKRAFRRG